MDKKPKRNWLMFILILLAVLVYAGFKVRYYYNEVFTMVAGLMAKNMCSAVYVSGFEFDDYLKIFDERGYGGVAEVVNDTKRRIIIATPHWFGDERVASFHNGAGCTLHTHGADQLPEGPHQQAAGQSTDPPSAKRSLARHLNPHLQAELNQYFADDPRTYAALVWHDGALRAESYGEGVTETTPLIGWSMTKSLAHAMLGVLFQRGILTPDSTDLLTQWHVPDPQPDTDPYPTADIDPRSHISIESLLRMSSGLDFDETYEIGGDAVTMLFNRADIPAYAASFELEHPIGEHWAYSSATTNILGRVMTEVLAEPLMPYMRVALFNVIGARTMLVEADSAGNPVLSSFGFASARDWLKLGILYMRDGDWYGRRVFPRGHAAAAADLTPASNGIYGQHFWLNREREDGTKQFPDLPADAYMMSGFDGQHVIIVPSLKLIMVRLGMNPDNDPALAFNLNAFSKRLLPHL